MHEILYNVRPLKAWGPALGESCICPWAGFPQKQSREMINDSCHGASALSQGMSVK